MVDQYFTTVWSDDVVYTVPIRTATVTNSTVLVQSLKHHLFTGDVVDVIGTSPAQDFSAPSTLLTSTNSNTFSYVTPAPPSSSFPTPKPGQGVLVWLTCAKYSRIISFPGRIRLTVPTGTVAALDIFDGGEWIEYQTVTEGDLETDLVFERLWKEVRLRRVSGTANPIAVIFHSTAPEQEDADTVFIIGDVPTVVVDPGGPVDIAPIIHAASAKTVPASADEFALVDSADSFSLKKTTWANLKAGITKGDVGLGNADDTSDVNKTISTATQTALNLKAPAASPTLTGTVNMNGSTRRPANPVVALDLDCSTGNVFTKTISANSTFTVSNVPDAGTNYTLKLRLTHTSGTITWFSGVIWPNGVAPSLTTGKVHLFYFDTEDGGVTWRAVCISNYAS